MLGPGVGVVVRADASRESLAGEVGERVVGRVAVSGGESDGGEVVVRLVGLQAEGKGDQPRLASEGDRAWEERRTRVP